MAEINNQITSISPLMIVMASPTSEVSCGCLFSFSSLSALTVHAPSMEPSWIEVPISADTTDEPIMSAYIELSRAGEHNRNNGDAIVVVKIRAPLMDLTGMRRARILEC